MAEKEQKENPLEEIMRIMGKSEEALLKKKITYQRVNGNIVARVTEDLREGEDGEVEIIKEQERLLDDNGYPIDSRSGVAQAECGCWISLRFLRRCPGCGKPLCRTCQAFIPEIGAVCATCYRLIKSQMRKRAIKNFLFRRKKSE